jgi:hypothetical protein
MNFNYSIVTVTYSRSESLQSYLRLTQFRLLEYRLELVIGAIKYIFSYMTNVIRVTLSIRDIPYSTFSHSPTFESILNKYVSYLRQINYTMTYIIDDTLQDKSFPSALHM